MKRSNSSSEDGMTRIGERKGLVAVFAVAAALRFFLFGHRELRESIAARVEVTTAVTSMTRIKEGVFLMERGASPYAGDMLHQPPLLLFLFYPICNAPVWVGAAVFTSLDLLCGALLWKVACAYMKTFEACQECCLAGTSAEDNDEDEEDRKDAMNEFSGEPKHKIAGDAFDMGVDHLLVSLLLLLALQGRWCSATAVLALAAHLSPYYLVLLPPVSVILQTSPARLSVPMAVASVGTWLAALLLFSRVLAGSWTFLNAVYSFALAAPDLTPNIGLFWYFFIEMFDHFKPFFLFIFQYSTAVYSIPLTMRYRHRPLFVIVLGIVSVFKSYPSVADSALYVPLLLTFRHHLGGIRSLFHLSQVFLFVAVLAPLFWHLWIVLGVGNANFYYALTLAYAVAQVMLLSEALLATARNDRRARARLRAQAAR